jgi:hypothetical protein
MSEGPARSAGSSRRPRRAVASIVVAGWAAVSSTTFAATAHAARGPGEWSPLAPVPAREVGVEGMAVGRVGKMIVAAYGYDAGDTRRTRLYDINADAWSTSSPAPLPRRSEAVAVSQGPFVYVLGGRRIDVLAEFERYAPSKDDWVSLPDMPTPRAGLAAAFVGGSLYAIGGRNGPSGPCSQGPGGQLATVERFDLRTNGWTTVASLPRARSDLAAVVVAGKIYVLGGCRVFGGGTRFLRAVDVYDPNTDSWSRSPANLPTARAAFYTVANLGGQVHVIGGYAGGGPLATHEVYMRSSDTYVDAAAMLTPRAEMGVVSARGRVYTVGGALPAFGESSDAHEMFVP